METTPSQDAGPSPGTPSEDAQEASRDGRPVGLRALFVLFFRAGMNFGGGLVVMTELLQELVERRRAISRRHFLTLYGLARLLPSGTMTGLAVGLGHYFAGYAGTVVTLAGVALPSLIPTIALTALYDVVRGSPWLGLVSLTLLPAAVALLAGAVLTLGKEIARPTPEPALAVLALVGALVLGVNPGLLLVLGGLAGAMLLRGEEPK